MTETERNLQRFIQEKRYSGKRTYGKDGKLYGVIHKAGDDNRCVSLVVQGDTVYCVLEENRSAAGPKFNGNLSEAIDWISDVLG